MEKIKFRALTFDDVLLLPRYTDFMPSEAKLETRVSKNISLKIPLISAAMDTVTEAKMAILRECGITVAKSPAEIGKLMAEKMGVSV